MKKKLSLIIASILILFCCFTFNSNQTKAASSYRVVIDWPVKAYEEYSVAPLYRVKRIRHITLQPGRSVRISPTLFYGTLVRDRYLGYKATKAYSRFWVVPNYKNYWYEKYSKYTYWDKSIFDNKNKEEHLTYKLNWKQNCKLISLGVQYKDYKYWGSQAKALIRQWGLKPSKD